MLRVPVRPRVRGLRHRIGARAASWVPRRLAHVRDRLVRRDVTPAGQSPFPERRAVRLCPRRRVRVDGSRTSRTSRLSARSHGSRTAAHQENQSATRVAHGEIPHCRFQAVAVRIRAERPSGPRRPRCPTLRDVGACAAQTRLLAGRRGTGCRDQQAHARTPHGERDEEIATVVFPESAYRAGGSTCSRPAARASRKLPRGWETRTARRSGPSCDGG